MIDEKDDGEVAIEPGEVAAKVVCDPEVGFAGMDCIWRARV